MYTANMGESRSRVSFQIYRESDSAVRADDREAWLSVKGNSKPNQAARSADFISGLLCLFSSALCFLFFTNQKQDAIDSCESQKGFVFLTTLILIRP